MRAYFEQNDSESFSSLWPELKGLWKSYFHERFPSYKHSDNLSIRQCIFSRNRHSVIQALHTTVWVDILLMLRSSISAVFFAFCGLYYIGKLSLGLVLWVLPAKFSGQKQMLRPFLRRQGDTILFYLIMIFYQSVLLQLLLFAKCLNSCFRKQQIEKKLYALEDPVPLEGVTPITAEKLKDTVSEETLGPSYKKLSEQIIEDLEQFNEYGPIQACGDEPFS